MMALRWSANPLTPFTLAVPDANSGTTNGLKEFRIATSMVVSFVSKMSPRSMARSILNTSA
jgi:hypothetical protein